MSKTEFNSYLIEAILYVLKQFSDKKLGILHGMECKLILNKLLSTRDYAVFYPELVYIIKYSLSSYMADSRLGAYAPRRLSAHIRLEFVE